jgi:hypothetical protein
MTEMRKREVRPVDMSFTREQYLRYIKMRQLTQSQIFEREYLEKFLIAEIHEMLEKILQKTEQEEKKS